MKARLVTLVAGASLLIATFGVSFSDAFFQDTKTTPQPISTDSPPRWLTIDSVAPDAEGSDEQVTVDVEAADPFPDPDVSEIEVSSGPGTPSVTLAPGELGQADVEVSTSTVELTIHLDDGSELGYRVPVEACTSSCG